MRSLPLAPVGVAGVGELVLMVVLLLLGLLRCLVKLGEGVYQGCGGRWVKRPWVRVADGV